MDNQFENEFYGYEPQKPITEKTGMPPKVEQALDTEGYEPAAPVRETDPDAPTVRLDDPSAPAPEMPFEDPNPTVRLDRTMRPDAPEPGQAQPETPEYNPIQHTAVYADNRFTGSQQPGSAPPMAPPQSYKTYNERTQQPPFVLTPPQVSPYAPRPENTFPKPVVPREKSKVNAALIVVIIVLGVLLTAALFGMVGYSMLQADKNQENGGGKQESSRSIMEQIPEFTFPKNGGGFPETPQTTEPAKEHKESDYSDQIDKNYGGMTLADAPADAQTNTGYNAAYAFKSVSDSVVSVLCYTDEPGDDSKPESQGSGIIISGDGFVITNAHVVNNSKTAYIIRVVTADGKSYTAGVVGFDSRTDLAVLKLKDAKDLKAAPFGNSDSVNLGDDLIIIGNPGGIEYQNSMTKGVVSAINRNASSRNIVKYIQTDAAINPGNSGGPAVNIYGQVVGVASAKIVDEKYEGMGFCIPSTQTKQIVDSLIRNGYVEGRVKIGITGSAVTAAEAESYGIPSGIIVASVDGEGPCGKTDLKKDDVITEVDGKAISSFAEIYGVLEEHKPGDKVKIKYYRQSDDKEYEDEITLQADN